MIQQIFGELSRKARRMILFPKSSNKASWLNDHQFQFNKLTYSYYFHRFNAGWPPERCTERIVELSVADRWLANGETEDLVEIGAVTPYYWPGRISRVVDPADSHPAVTERKSLFDMDLTGKSVLSISTIEHVGLSQYGTDEQESTHDAINALKKISREASEFLITIPVGYNPTLDKYLFSDIEEDDQTQRYFLVRDGNYQWHEVLDKNQASIPYGGPDWANSLVVLERGGRLELAKQKYYRALVIFDYEDWILGTWAREIKKQVEPSIRVDIVSMSEIDAAFISSHRHKYDVVHPLLPHAFDLARQIDAPITISTIHHWTEPAQYQSIINESEYLITGATSWKAALVERGVDPERIGVFRSGASSTFFVPVADRNFTSDRLVVGFFAKADSNEDDRKGIGRLARLWSLIAESELTSNYHFIVSGDGWNEIVSEHRNNGISIDYRGRVGSDQMVGLYDELDSYLVLSRVEGGPATISEAMARGCVVITTPVGLAIETIESGKNGFLLRQDNAVEPCLEILEEVRQDIEQRRKISSSARTYAEQKLTYDKTFQHMGRYYLQCLQGTSSKKMSVT